MINDFFPLFNSIRVALISSFFVFIIGLFLAYYVKRLPKLLKGFIDVILTLPLVLPPTVIGYFLLLIFSPNNPFGSWLINVGFQVLMDWKGAIIASIIVAFPLMYRSSRAAFESFNEDLANVGKTLGLSNFSIFWKIRFPNCKNGIIAGIILSFARAIGEYGATSMICGYIPSKTATISTTVTYHWSINDNKTAFIWVMINLAISAIVLIVVNIIEGYKKKGKKNHEYLR